MKKEEKKKKCFHFLRILSLNRKVSTSTLCVNYVINKGKREKWEAEMMKNTKILSYPEPCNQKRELREREIKKVGGKQREIQTQKFSLTLSSFWKYSRRKDIGFSGLVTHSCTIHSFSICCTLCCCTYSSHSRRLCSSSKLDAIPENRLLSPNNSILQDCSLTARTFKLSPKMSGFYWQPIKGPL